VRLNVPIVVSLSTLPRRAGPLETAVGALRSIADVRVHLAPEQNDPGPIWKWIAPQEISPHCVVVVVDDDMVYTPARIERLVERLYDEADPLVVQALGVATFVRDNPFSHGGPFFESVPVPEGEARTEIVQAFAGVAMWGRDFLGLRAELERPPPAWPPRLRDLDLRPTDRLADDYVVSRAIARLGWPALALSMPEPPALETSMDAGALWRQGPGHVARYTALARWDAATGRRWWGGSP